MNIEIIAKIAHEVNKAYCEAIGDNSQESWNKAPQWQKDSVIDGVDYILAYPNSSPKVNHERWLKHKLNNGWKYGIVKDTEKKEHPCLVPFDQLLEEQQAKNYIFTAICKSLLWIKA
jgi:hypothetical protein